jgi:Ca2+-binding RTX toxin-like protein
LTTDPPSPANYNFPNVKGTAEPLSRVRIYYDDCVNQPTNTEPSAESFAADGIQVFVDDNSSTTYRVKAVDRANNVSECSAPITYVEDSCSVSGTPGNDTITGTPDSEVICGRGGNDTINGGEGDDTILGGDGDDILSGDGGDDRLEGGSDAGYDRLDGGTGWDRLDGGPGIDRALYSGATGPITITIDGVTDDLDGYGFTDNVFTTVESITASPHSDDVTGSCSNNVLAGIGGDDALKGDPEFCVPYGNDFIGGGAGGDTMLGSATPTDSDGTDRVVYTAPNGPSTGTVVTLDGTANDTDGQGGTDNVGTDIEYLYGGAQVDSFGASGALQGVALRGGAGNDFLTGSPFNDFLSGEAGADTLDCAGGGTDIYQTDGVDLSITNCEELGTGP